MALRKKIFDQLVGKLKAPKLVNYITYVWQFVDAEINDADFVNESNYEISGRYTKSGNPLLIDTEEIRYPLHLQNIRACFVCRNFRELIEPDPDIGFCIALDCEIDSDTKGLECWQEYRNID